MVLSHNKVVSTSAGGVLPTTELGNAGVPTKSVSLDISKVTPAQYKEAVIETVQSVAPGGTFVLETNKPACFDAAMIESLAARNDIDINVIFTFNGMKMRVLIPKGYNVRSLLDENGYCGFLRLASILSFYVL